MKTEVRVIPDVRYPLTDISLMHIRSLSDEDAAEILDARMGVLEDAWKTSFVERGWVALEFEERLLWQLIDDPNTGLPFTSKEKYIAIRCPQSRSDVYAALKAVKELRDVPREALRSIPRCNVNVLQSLSSKVRQQPEVLEAAKNLSERAFVAKVAADFPQQHIESKHVMKLSFTASSGEAVERLIQQTMDRDGYTSKEECIEAWGVDYMLGESE